MAMTPAILRDRAVRAGQCSVWSGFLTDLIFTAGAITQQGPSKSVTYYYRRSHRCVPRPELI